MTAAVDQETEMMNIRLKTRDRGVSYLVVMRCTDKNDGSFSWYIEGSARPDFPEENLGDSPPEKQDCIVFKCLLFTGPFSKRGHGERVGGRGKVGVGGIKGLAQEIVFTI